MTRKLPIAFTLAVVVLLALGAWWRHGRGPHQAVQTYTQSGGAATQAASGGQPAAAAQATPASGGPVSSAQAADAGSTSLEHLAAVPQSAALPESSKWKVNVNYDVISPAQPITVAPGKVEVLEVFWLGCPHCFLLESYIRQWLKTKPAYVEFVRVPVMWGPMQRAHARLYYTLESLGRDDLAEKVFAYIHDKETQTGTDAVLVSNSQEDTFRQQQAWAAQNGIDADAFAKAYNSFYVNTQLQQADAITNNYQVQGVPFIAIDGKFSTDVGKASGGPEEPDKLIALINFLTAWEHDHMLGAG
jgi:thiol:disulfide interchange protein DsbA